ncbi:nuclear transport factor 2 family protein [Microbispora sp. H10836]|uniref:nuclear transport factor 2 family protein n=1 Tax=Microbispora sp. H10836 TaxID=2729106 RepID=UPI001B8ABAF2|nr:nuclear transport factor 2 family protein [Microbispora sp. H10836]
MEILKTRSEVENMDDIEQIKALCFGYTFCLDEGDFEGVGEFLREAVLQPDMPGVEGERISGRDAIEEFYRAQVITYSRGRPMTRHLITNQVITFEGTDAAKSRCYFTVLQRPPGADYHIVVGGQYHDRFVREDGSWRFTEKRIQVDHLNDIQNHFRITPEHATGPSL